MFCVRYRRFFRGHRNPKGGDQPKQNTRSPPGGGKTRSSVRATRRDHGTGGKEKDDKCRRPNSEESKRLDNARFDGNRRGYWIVSVSPPNSMTATIVA